MSSIQSRESMDEAPASSTNAFWSDASYGVGDQIGCAVHCRLVSGQVGPAIPFKILAYLGKGTSTDAELIGGIIGCVVVRLFAGTDLGAETKTVWYSDCKTVVEKARLATVRGGYWQAWLEASAAVRCEAVYVAPKQRSNDHTSCDRASRWVRMKGEKLLENYGESPVGRLAKLQPEVAWHLVDGRNFLSELHGFGPDSGCEVALNLLREQISRVFAYRVSS